MATDNQIYNEYSTAYDRILLNWPSYLELLELHLSYCGKAEKILDFGSGTGNQAGRLAEDGKEVYAIDINEEMLKFTQAKSTSKLLQTRVMSVEKVDFGDAFFDIVTSMNVLYNIPNPIKAMREAFRVLKPGGLFLVSGPMAGGDVEGLAEDIKQALFEKNLYDEQTAKDLDMMIDTNRHLTTTGTYYNAAEFEKILVEDVGFRKVLFSTEKLYLGNACFVAVEK